MARTLLWTGQRMFHPKGHHVQWINWGNLGLITARGWVWHQSLGGENLHCASLVFLGFMSLSSSPPYNNYHNHYLLLVSIIKLFLAQTITSVFFSNCPLQTIREGEQREALCCALLPAGVEPEQKFLFYPQDTTSFWADIQSFSNPPLMGVIRGKQWSNNHGEMPAVNIKGCSSGDRNSGWDILVSCVTQIKMFPTQSVLSSSKLHMVESLWCENHT